MNVALYFFSNKASGLSDAYYFHEDCFLMGTIARPRLQGPELLVQQHFRWVQLRWDGEPMHSLLHKVLKRRVVHKVCPSNIKVTVKINYINIFFSLLPFYSNIIIFQWPCMETLKFLWSRWLHFCLTWALFWAHTNTIHAVYLVEIKQQISTAIVLIADFIYYLSSDVKIAKYYCREHQHEHVFSM